MTNNFEELNQLSDKEKELALKILEEYSNAGNSSTYTNIIYEDYNEIPVGIEEFLHNPKYLGNALTDAEGRFTIYPYWVDVLKKIFPDPLEPAQYNTAVFTGAIGLGKSTVAVIAMCYELYRMMCLKNPYVYYGLQEIDVITFAVINITIDAAEGVAWSKIQNMVQASTWFMERGTVNKADPPQWFPPKGIELIYGSRPQHIIGRALFSCLDGDTEILVSDGVRNISSLENEPIKVYNIDDNNNLVLTDTCTVKMSGLFNEEYHLELEDGTIIKCTPNHKFMLKNGLYKEAQFLTEDDELADI